MSKVDESPACASMEPGVGVEARVWGWGLGAGGGIRSRREVEVMGGLG